ncbi:hypothetical protein [Dolichospermum circinale]|uniref:hypothetical protein n=1 Tax=Dolichospermum circinale TaxID=109265 RepID=UPI00232B4C64|nr:hypothetical protein [Dolichospermum circinale]MDB9465923.1 hypothetical protein [Dolichospermum circinale CS-539/09]MDB9471207.1 hypothetical protein [Dolichospermum circinale CS-539]
MNTLVQAAIETVQAQATEAQEESIRRTLGSFLSRIYYDLRNLGTTSQAGRFHFLNSSRRKSETFTIIRSFFRS